MAKISGWIFLGIGILFTGLSFYVNSAQNTNSMTIFIYLGYAFIAYGIAKILVKYIMKKNKNEKKLNKELPEDKTKWHRNNQKNNSNKHSQNNINMNSHNSNQNTNNHIKNNPESNDMNGYIGLCARCGTPMRKVNVYCHRCGMKQQ